MAYPIEVMSGFGFTPADHEVKLLNSATYGPFNGTASVSMGAISYTPTSGYVGTDVIEYSICDITQPMLCDTGTIFIDVFEGNCAYVMEAYSTWKRCPNTCNTGGGLLPVGQPTPDNCWGYVFFFENTSNDTIFALDADFYIDSHMSFEEGSGMVDGGHSTTSAQVSVNFIDSLHQAHFELDSGEYILPHEIYEYSFAVHVDSFPFLYFALSPVEEPMQIRSMS